MVQSRRWVVRSAVTACALVLSVFGPADGGWAAPTERMTPQAPVIEDVQPADGAVTVTVEVGDGSAAISRVEVQAREVDDQGEPTGEPVATGSVTEIDPANPTVATVTGLSDGVDYAFTATQVTSTGEISAASPAYLGGPQAPEVPLAPTVDSVFGRNHSLVVTWNPAESGGSPVTAYTVRVVPLDAGLTGATLTAGGTASTLSVPGLVNGALYRVSVTASNAVGEGEPGHADGTTVGAGAGAGGVVAPEPPYPAGPPIHVSAGPPEPGANGRAPDPTALVVRWNPPVDDGGSTIPGYTVTATTPRRPTVTVTAPAGSTSATLTHLARDVEYAVTVRTIQSPAARVPTGRTARFARTASAAADPADTSGPVSAAAGPVLDAETVTLSTDSVASITAVSPTSVVFTNPPAQVQGLAVRNIIAVGQNTNPLTQAGLLRSVDSVSRDGEVWTFQTEQATLDESFPHLDVTAADDDAAASRATVRMLDPRFQARVNTSAANALTGRLDLDLSEKINNDPKTGASRLPEGVSATAKLSAELSITPDWSARAGFERDPRTPWWKFWDLVTFTYNFRAATTIKASVRGELGIAYTFESKKTPLATIGSLGSCVWVYVVAFCPKLTIYTQTTVDGSIKFTFDSTYERTMGGEVSRNSVAQQSKRDLTTAPVQTFTYALTAKATATVAFPFELQVLIYDLVGPQLTITPKLVLTADTAANPWLTFAAGLDVGVFFVADLKVQKFSFGGSVYSASITLFDSGGPFPAPSLSGTTSAGATSAGGAARPSAARSLDDTTPVRYTVVWPANCDPGESVTWSMADGSRGTVDEGGLYTTPSPLPAGNFVDVIEATTDGSAGCPATTVEAAVHYGPGEPSPPTGVTISPDGSQVSWQPGDDGGAPVTGYLVSVAGDPDDPESADYVLGTVSGQATTLPIPAGRVEEIEADRARIAVTALNERGQSPDSDLSAPGSAADALVTMTAEPQGLLSGNITFTPAVTDIGPDGITATEVRFSYPQGFLHPVVSPGCRADTATRTVTCAFGPIAAGDQGTASIRLTAGLLAVRGAFTFTATRSASSPFATDPHDGTDSRVCTVLTALLIRCSQPRSPG